MKRMHLHNHLTISLSVLCGALMLIALAEITFLDPADFAIYSDDSNTNIDLPKIANLKFIPKSPGNFTHILERPLLFEGRRMPAAPVVAAQPKKPADPPSASAVSPKGVSTESRATLPIIVRDISHPFRGRDPNQIQSVS